MHTIYNGCLLQVRDIFLRAVIHWSIFSGQRSPHQQPLHEMMICFQRMSQLLKCEHAIANAFRAEFSSSWSGGPSQDPQPTTTPIRGLLSNSLFLAAVTKYKVIP